MVQKETTKDLFYDPIYMDIITYIFAFQDEKNTFISRMTLNLLHPTNYVDITKTSEYIKIFRAVRDLESLNLINKVKPEDKGKSQKSYYEISLKAFCEEIVRFYLSLPTYSHEKDRLIEKFIFNYKDNKKIIHFLGLYFRCLSIDLMNFKQDNKFKLKSFNLRDALFLLMQHLVPKKFLDYDCKGMLSPFGNIDPKYLKRLDLLKKDKEEYNFLLFLLILKSLSKDFVPFAYIDGFNYELSEFIAITVFGSKDTFNYGRIKEVIDNEKKIFNFYPTD